MKYTLQTLALASAASARVLQTRQSSCCFGINVSGDGVQGGSLGQLTDGQNRFGPNQSGATYCIDDGKITDKNGRGCILTGPTTQFQCDQGASPTGGFSVASSGQVEHDGDATFYACPVDDNGNYNIYTKPLDNMPKCVKVGLSSADGTCAAPSSAPVSSAPSSAPASSAPPATTAVSVSVSVSTPAPSVSVAVSTEQCQPSTTQTQTQTQTQPPVTEEVTQKTTVEQPTTIEQPTTVQSPVTETKSVQQPPAPVTETKVSSSQQPSATPSGTGNCPRDLPGMDSYLKPRLIVPVNSNQPDTAYGTQYNAYVGNGNSTIFSFDVPQSYEGKQCEVIFTFPTQSQLETSFVSESGNGGIDFKQLKSAADEKTTFNNQPAVAKDFGEKGVSTGNAYTITTGDCAVGQTISYELTATGDYQASWFQDWNPCPIGLWVVAN
ncbi:hypothetical protein M436DRAFT_41835 [Aureobasidium namibiae CBS 147.97]|uniref:Uncharacterized protein n=1 Tax=Aureobasidium namibiae CBS 147.97 TaxID=1043004 RepID=A0A074WVW9_9PEZI|nr:uncharacterized protein M436DRAFT_41835 [Aureobasidium namibiae CBS 147.97]KEQ75644.1 hypothetical protein M436DRAFT_41835 [Aureobasidium namibiae CBS 147.97]